MNKCQNTQINFCCIYSVPRRRPPQNENLANTKGNLTTLIISTHCFVIDYKMTKTKTCREDLSTDKAEDLHR